MMHVQRRIPMLDQIALFGDPRRFSGWCGVRHDMRRPRPQRIIKPLMVWNAFLKTVGHSEIKRNEVAIG